MTKTLKHPLIGAAIAGVILAAGPAVAETTLKVGHVFAADHPWHVSLEGLAKDVG